MSSFNMKVNRFWKYVVDSLKFSIACNLTRIYSQSMSVMHRDNRATRSSNALLIVTIYTDSNQDRFSIVYCAESELLALPTLIALRLGARSIRRNKILLRTEKRERQVRKWVQVVTKSIARLKIGFPSYRSNWAKENDTLKIDLF